MLVQNQPEELYRYLRLQIQGVSINPMLTKKYLLREMSIEMLQNIFVILVHINLIFTLNWEQQTCNHALAIWLIMIMLINVTSFLSKVFFLVLLLFLRNPPLNDRTQKTKFAKQLRNILSSEIYIVNSKIMIDSLIYYALGLLIVIISTLKGLFLPAQCFDQNPIRMFASIIVVTQLFNQYFIDKQRNGLKIQLQSAPKRAFTRTIKYHQIKKEQKSICSICLEKFNRFKQISEFQCQGLHLFHDKCIKKWCLTQINFLKKCPYCKQIPPEYE